MDNDSGAEEEIINGDNLNGEAHTSIYRSVEDGAHLAGGRIAELLKEERQNIGTPEPLGNGANRYKRALEIDDVSDEEYQDAVPGRSDSPVDSMLSIPDDTPSIQVGHTVWRLFFYS